MATLVLHTVGTAFGGPIGGAIGSLLGQSIDQQLFGSGKGPHLGSLKVQGSSYGSPIPRLYGTMRVAGSIVWATDLKESSSSGDFKGQPGSLTYSVSLAIALSSRPVTQVKRIWADGKLVRGAAGDFKVGCTFRFYAGDEQQQVDPLIASIETIGSTPAYRGIALAVFEDLQLGDFGNRIPFFTFEVESDPSPPTITAILADASGGKIAASDQRNVVGYAAYGDAIQPAVQPFVDHFGIQLFDDGQSLRAPTSASFDCLDTELGCSADLQPQPRAERSQVAARSLPTALTVEYYDPARDFQAAQSRASIPSALAKTASEQLPAALDCGFARALTETALARQWAERDTLRLRLPPPYLTLEPGMFLKRPNDTAYWTVSRTETDGMAVIADLHSRYGSFESMASDPGRVLSSPDVEVQPTQLAILELPDIDGTAGDAPQLSIAASSAAGAWKPVAVQIDTSGISQISQTAALPTILGVADTVLGDGQSILFDERSSVDVQLTSHEHWLQSCDDDALVNGGNLAAVGTELIQFGKVETLGAGKFRLSRLLRGRRGTEWAMGTHGAGETFAMIDPTRLQPVPVPVSAIGSDLSATALGLGDDAAVPVVHTVSGEALKPPSPVHLTAEFDSAGNLNCSWCRRSRSGWAWIDNVDAPLGCSSELYTVQLQGSASRLELQTNVASATFRAADITTIGSGMVLNVTQVGDFAVSRPATIQINS